MITSFIAAVVVAFLLGMLVGYYIRINWKKFKGWNSEAKETLEMIEDTATGWYRRGRRKAQKEYQEVLESLRNERDMLKKYAQDWEDWWAKHSDDAK